MRTITLSDAFTGKTMYPNKDSGHKRQISFSNSNLSDEELSDAVSALCFKLLSDKLRSKAKQKGFELSQIGSDNAILIQIDLARFFERRPGKRLTFADLDAEEILTKIEEQLTPEKLQALIELMSKRTGR